MGSTLRTNNLKSFIVNKYCEGKVKRNLIKFLKEPEI